VGFIYDTKQSGYLIYSQGFPFFSWAKYFLGRRSSIAIREPGNMGRVYYLFAITGLTHEPESCRFWEGRWL
jgi:hypothetical protein